MQAVSRALSMAFAMTWQILWALILGFSLSAVVQTVVRRPTIVRLLGDDRARSLAAATGLGAASSSCSYAAVALARALFRRGANFTSAMAFEIASTNLVIELGIIMAILLGWQFTLAEYLGGPILIVLVALLFRLVLRDKLLREARDQAELGRAGVMEGHAVMDMSIKGSGTWLQRLKSPAGFTAVSHVFVTEFMAVARDIAIGLLLAGALAAWVPTSVWQTLFLANDGRAALLWGPIVGPIVAILSFVCSIGNVPLAAVLWNSGISFGGVISFMFADLLILPILNIYRKYYGPKMTAVIVATFYVSMVATGYVIEVVFAVLGITPTTRAAVVPEAQISLNYTSVLNVVFLGLAAVLVWRFATTGGPSMLRMMGGGPRDPGLDLGDTGTDWE